MINLGLTEEEQGVIKDLHLLTNKPFLYIANVKEDEIAAFDSNKWKEELGLGAGQEILPNVGDTHQRRCLEALALFQA